MDDLFTHLASLTSYLSRKFLQFIGEKLLPFGHALFPPPIIFSMFFHKVQGNNNIQMISGSQSSQVQENLLRLSALHQKPVHAPALELS